MSGLILKYLAILITTYEELITDVSFFYLANRFTGNAEFATAVNLKSKIPEN